MGRRQMISTLAEPTQIERLRRFAAPSVIIVSARNPTSLGGSAVEGCNLAAIVARQFLLRNGQFMQQIFMIDDYPQSWQWPNSEARSDSELEGISV